MRKFNLFQKMMASLLAIMLVLGLLPASALRGYAAENVPNDTGSASLPKRQPGITQHIADAPTLHNWKAYFGEQVISTEFAGGVWTDKSVMTNADEFQSILSMNDAENHFLISLSALAANQQIVGYSSAPVDVMLVLDVSGSMQGNKATTMVQAVNETLHSLLEQNKNNRVGVVMFSGNANTSSNATPGTATVLLPLDRYTTQSTQTVGRGNDRKTIPVYLNISSNSVSVDSTVRDSNDQRENGSKNVSGGTYIQNGLYKAWGEFSKVTDVKVPAGQAQAGAQRTPVMVLFSDGQPTVATASYNQIGNSQSTYGDGRESSTTWRTVVLSQLTAAWAKGKMAAHYGTTAKFYTIGLGTGSSSYATAVLDPASANNDTLAGYWDNYFDNSQLDNRGNVSLTNNWKVVKDSNVASKNYVDLYKLAANTDEMLDAFQDIVESIELDAAGHVTLVEGKGENLSGYITFTDELGIFMEVKDMKGLVLGNRLYTGAQFARRLGDGSYGSMAQPTALGSEFVNSVCERIGLDTPAAQNLVLAAYQDGQIAYTSDDNFSNYLGWYSTDDGTYLGFWDKDTGITAQGAPEGATWINKSYLFQDSMNGSDMMHIVVLVATHIESQMQVIQFKIPASLIPKVTYEIALEGSDVTKMESINRKGAEPLRLVYEIGLQDSINAVNMAQIIEAAEAAGYGHSHKEADGSYAFYTNLWGAEHGGSVDYTDPLGHRVAQSHFHPAEGNDRYYYTEDTPVYVKNGNTYTPYTGSAAPTGDGYYHTHHYYTAGGYTTDYLPVSASSLQQAVAKGQQADGCWYIPEGAIFQQIDRFHMLKGGDANSDGKADGNITGTLEYYDYPVVVDVGEKYDTYAFLGNNGKITIMPAQGIRLTKTVTEAVEGSADAFTFDITLSQAVAAPTVTDSNGDPLTSGWSVSGNVITVTLKAGDTVCITGLPTGVTYTVTEQYHPDYISSSGNATGTVQTGTIHPVDFVNIPRGYGNLIVSKDVDHPFTVAPDAMLEKEFSITVTLSGDHVANQQFAIAGTDPVSYITTDASGSFTVNLKDQGSLTLVGLPEGTTFTATENLDPVAHKGFTMDASRSVLSGTIQKDTTAQAHVVNVYAPAAPGIKVQVAGEKLLTDETGAFQWNDTTFTVLLQHYDPATGTYTDLGTQQVSQGDLAYLFADHIQLDTLGSHYFKVSEVIPAERMDGMSYDASVGRFEVVVTDNDVDGIMELAVYDVDTGARLPADGNTVTYRKNFENIYTTEATFVEFTVNKDVLDPHNTGASEAGYLFELYEVIGGVVQTAPAYSMRTVLVGGQGQATFHIPVNKVGTRTFILKEVAPAEFDRIPGMIYDDAQYTVTVVGYSNLASKLTAEVTITDSIGAAQDSVTFVNEIDLEPLVLTPGAHKTLTGREPMEDDEFRFYLEQTDGSFVPGSLPGGYADDASVTYAQLKADGIAYFEEIEITQVGTYYYRLTEVAGSNPAIAYDSTIYHIVVVATVDGNRLSKNISIIKVGEGIASTPTDYVEFVNTYTNSDTAQVAFGGTKTLTGRPLITDEFRFQLKKDGVVLQTVSNAANGSFQFLPITYTYADIGTHTYTVSELNEGKGGITYDGTVHTITVTVADSGDGELLVTTSGADGIRFNNTYSYGGPISILIPGHKSWSNMDTGIAQPMEGGEFTFAIHATNADYSEKGAQIATATNTASGEVVFNLHFSAPGEYYYLLSEVIPSDENRVPGVAYDTGVYQVHIQVYDTGSGALVGHVQRIYKVGSGSDTVTFQNYYTPAAAEVVLEGTKTLTGRPMQDGEFRFQLLDAENNPLQTVTNHNGAFAFQALSFDKSGTYTYTIREIIPQGAQNYVYEGVTYDSSVLTVTITVTDDGFGRLVTATRITEGQAETELVFENSYSVDQFTQFSFSGTKTLTGLDLQAGQFLFQLVDSNGNPFAQTRNDANGSFRFDNLPLSGVGTHTFTLREVNEGKGGITYDDRVYTVTVTTADDGKGNLTVSPVTVQLNGADADPVFANTYTAQPVSYTPRANKIFLGDAMRTFRFQLSGDGFATQEKENDATGAVAFDALEFTAAGTYTFTVSELPISGMDDVRWDTNVYTLEIQVTDNGEGQLELTASVSSTLGRTDLTFRNVKTDIITEKDVYLPGQITASIDGKTVAQGGVLTYTISYTNYTGKAGNVTITDTIPANTAYVEGSADNGGVFADGKLTWNLQDVAADATVVVSFRVQVTATTGTVENQAQVVEGTNTYTTNIITNPIGENKVEKDVFFEDRPTVSIDGQAVQLGDILLYQVTYHNSDDFPADVTITDTIPQYTSYVDGSADNGGVLAEGKLTWNLQLKAGESITVSFKVKVDAANVTVVNQASALEGNNALETNAVQNPVPEDKMEKDVFVQSKPTVSIDGQAVQLGDILVYSITYHNSFEAAADVTITDTVPQYTAYVEGSADNGGAYAGGKLTWNVHLEAGESITVTFKVKVTSAGVTVVNQASALEGSNTVESNAVTTTVKEPPVTPPTGDNFRLDSVLFTMGISAMGIVVMLAVLVLTRKKEQAE